MSTRSAMVGKLKAKNAITTPEVEAAFLRVDLEAFLDGRHAFLAYESVPLPIYEGVDRVVVLPSPHFTAMLLQLLGLEPGSDLLIYGGEGAYLSALAYELTQGRRVEVLELDGNLADAARRSLRNAGYEGHVTVTSGLPRDEWTRVAVLQPSQGVIETLKPSLKDLGVLTYWQTTKDGGEFVKLLRNGSSYPQLSFGEAGFAKEARETNSFNLRALLSLECLLANVWKGKSPTTQDRYFRELTGSTFEGGPWDRGSLEAEDLEASLLAKKVFHLAYIYQMLGDLENAERLYSKSLEAYATAEAHTFLGWVYSFQDRLYDAVQECMKAVSVDPTFGNPYNDIGAYLIQEGQLEEAIPWLKKALGAERYCCYFYANCNLGRVYMMLGDYGAAQEQFKQALKVNPSYELARQLLREVEGYIGPPHSRS